MEFPVLIKTRQSTRSYSTTEVNPGLIEKCLEAARLAPSACNAQPWKFVVVTDASLRDKIANAMANTVVRINHFTKQAPVMVVVVREKANFTSKAGSLIHDKDYTLIDLGIATEHFCLQATAIGLGTCMLGWFNEKKVKKLLGIPAAKRAELIITVGYPAEGDPVREKKRKKLEEIVSFNSY